MSWRVVVLAAGQGTRMRSELAKVLHTIEGKSLLARVLDTASELPIESIAVIVGHQHEKVRAAHARPGISFFLQEPQRGTGHAVQQAVTFLDSHDGSTLILYGDVPLLRRSTLLELIEEHESNEDAATVLTARVPDPSGYGRIVRDGDGKLQAIVEDKDLDPRDRGIDEINSGIYAFRTGPLVEALATLRDDNRQKELYLTDTIRTIRERGLRVSTYTLADPLEISGINTPEQLDAAAAVLARRRLQGNEDCPICAQARDGASYPILARRPGALLIVTARPYNSGQLSAHPERHVLHHASLLPEERRAVWDLARLGARAVEAIYHPQGMNIGAGAARPAAHFGIEVIPRWVGDSNFLPLLADVTLLPEEPHRSWERLREHLESQGEAPPTPADRPEAGEGS